MLGACSACWGFEPLTADAVPDAALTLFAEHGYHGKHPPYARARAGLHMSAGGGC
jgi:hypothetical protein